MTLEMSSLINELNKLYGINATIIKIKGLQTGVKDKYYISINKEAVYGPLTKSECISFLSFAIALKRSDSK